MCVRRTVRPAAPRVNASASQWAPGLVTESGHVAQTGESGACGDRLDDVVGAGFGSAEWSVIEGSSAGQRSTVADPVTGRARQGPC